MLLSEQLFDSNFKLTKLMTSLFEDPAGLADLVSGLEIPEDRGVVEEGQVGHVLALLELGRVDLPQLLGFEDFFLKYFPEFYKIFLTTV